MTRVAYWAGVTLGVVSAVVGVLAGALFVVFIAGVWVHVLVKVFLYGWRF